MQYLLRISLLVLILFVYIDTTDIKRVFRRPTSKNAIKNGIKISDSQNSLSDTDHNVDHNSNSNSDPVAGDKRKANSQGGSDFKKRHTKSPMNKDNKPGISSSSSGSSSDSQKSDPSSTGVKTNQAGKFKTKNTIHSWDKAKMHANMRDLKQKSSEIKSNPALSANQKKEMLQKEVAKHYTDFGGSYSEGKALFPGRKEAYELNHVPPQKAYENTPYKNIKPEHMPVHLQAYTDHRAYPTTGNEIHFKDKTGKTYRYTNQLQSDLSKNNFAQALKTEIQLTKHNANSGIDYRQSLHAMVDYCATAKVPNAPVNKEGGFTLITASEAKQLHNEINSS